MKITRAFKLRAFFDAGMQIAGDKGDLIWLYTEKQFNKAQDRIQDYLDLKAQEKKERSYGYTK